MNRRQRHTMAIRANDQKTHTIIIPAAGIGRRMKTDGPISLFGTYGESMLDRQLRIIKKHLKNVQIIVVCGFESHKIIKTLPDDVLVVENERYEETNVVRSIGMALQVTHNNHLIVMYGDTFFNYQHFAVDYADESFLLLSDAMEDREAGVTINGRGYVENVMFDLPNKWSHIAYFTGQEAKLLRKFCCDRRNAKKLGLEALNHIINKRGKFSTVKPEKGFCFDVDYPQDYQRVKDYVNSVQPYQ